MAGGLVVEFRMFSARAAMAEGLSHIEAQVSGLEEAVNENPGLAFDFAKIVVESTCRTILSERQILFAKDDDLPKLFKAVTLNLPLLPFSASTEAEARKRLAQTLGGLHTALLGVCELRNSYGFASHGSEGPRPVMESVQALLAAQAADTIVGFLHRVHCQDRARRTGEKLQFADNAPFNTFVDEANEVVRIFDLKYRPSEVLFGIDKDAYRDLLADFSPKQETSAAAEAERPAGEEP